MCAKKVTQEENPRDDVRIYLGPTLHRRTLVTGSCYRGGLNGHITGLIEKIPEIGVLTVPVENMVTVKRKIGEPGTEENRVYQYLKTIRFDDKGEVRN